MCSHASLSGSNTRTFSRSDSLRYMEHTCLMMEKRQLFLRSYQFSRKRSLASRIVRSFAKNKRVIWFRLRSAARWRKPVCSRLSRFRQGFWSRRRLRFLHVILNNCRGYQSRGYQSRGVRNSCSCLC